MSLINTLENKLGRYAIPGVVNILAGFQVVVWVMMKLKPEFGGFIELNRSAVLNGQLWRLVTWVFVPPAGHPIWLFFAVMLLTMMGRGLEEAWGAFRLNLYIFGGMTSIVIGAMIFNCDALGIPLYSTILFAFAVFFPNYEFLLFFILPLKVKWIAALGGAMLFLTILDTPEARLPVIFSLLNFLIAFGPGFLKGASQRAAATERKSRFDMASRPAESFLHKCQACGKTELDDPQLDFRVNAEGHDICQVCRAKK